MKLKTLFAAAAVAAGLCLTGMSAVQAAPKMPESISITYVKSPFNLQNIVMKERGMLEDAFKAEGVKINWRVINSGAIQGQAMASGDLDFSAVMNTAKVLRGGGGAPPCRCRQPHPYCFRCGAPAEDLCHHRQTRHGLFHQGSQRQEGRGT